ncbi:hypothetical protein C8J57DRAFT_1490496 [Mycena rebaudengoi]|nr:hypothetical protein C8J57DRAFT_1490496 [Mycena rebaudengoi]
MDDVLDVGFRKMRVYRHGLKSSLSAPEHDDEDSEYGLDDVEPYVHALFQDIFSRPHPQARTEPPALVAHPNSTLDAIAPVRAPVPTAKKPLIVFPHNNIDDLFDELDSTRDNSHSSETTGSQNTEGFLCVLEKVTGQTRCTAPLEKDIALGTWNWVLDLADDQDIDRQRQVNWRLEAFQEAYQLIYGVLETHLDTSAMATQANYTAVLLNEGMESSTDSSPDPDVSALSLDYSLPDSIQGAVGDKRKRDEEGEEVRKRFVSPDVGPPYDKKLCVLKPGKLCRMRRPRRLLTSQKLVLENVPLDWIQTHHPLLTTEEVDKMRVLQLAFTGEDQHQLAGLLHHLLQVKFQDEYALGHLLVAGFLDQPKQGHTSSGLWDILDGSDVEWDETAITAPVALPMATESSRPTK